MPAPAEGVYSSLSGGLGTIIISRPKAYNALTLGMVRDLAKEIEALRVDRDVKVLLMKGAGTKAFCAGGDVVQIRDAVMNLGAPSRGQGGHLGTDFYREEYQLSHRLMSSSGNNSNKPLVSLWDGFVIGSGVVVSIGSTFRVATEKTAFSMPETTLGMIPDGGCSYWLPRLDGGAGYYIGLTGAKLMAYDLILTGIATHYVPSSKIGKLEEALDVLASKEVQVKAEDVQSVLDSFNEAPDPSISSLMKHKDVIDTAFSASSVEAILDHLKLQESDWAATTLNGMLKAPPTALKLAHESLHRGRLSSLEAAFASDYKVTQVIKSAGEEGLLVFCNLSDKKVNPSPFSSSSLINRASWCQAVTSLKASEPSLSIRTVSQNGPTRH